MSLFGFVKDVGRSLFKKDEQAAAAIKQHIEANNPGVSSLAVSFDDGIVGLSGECVSVAALQKCILMAGNVKGVADVYVNGLTVKAGASDMAPASAAAPAAAPATAGAPANAQTVPASNVPVEYYLIKSGDTLSRIAKQHYGDANQYPRIFDANREVIEHPDKIFPGQKIRIPRD